MGILSRVVPLVALGLGVIFVGTALFKPKDAGATVDVFEEGGSAIGSSLGAIGRGGQALGEGIGGGLVGLLKPFWEIRNLVNLPSEVESTQVSGSANSSAVAQNEGGNRSSNTITWSSGASRSVPALSAAARSFYSSRGVSVS